MTKHYFTVDVEEYFQVCALEPHVPRERWHACESRVQGSVEVILSLLEEAGARGTFFTLGDVAHRCPGLMRLISNAGHEIASHGCGHRRVTELTADEFRESVRRSKLALEDLTGCAVLGYRAPSFSIVPGREWALDILLEEGYLYDSSLFPIRRRGYGYSTGARDPYWISRPGGRLLEVPPATLRRLGLNLPAAGGAYFRILPYALVRSALADCESRGVPGTFYIHPWEVDPGQPRFRVPMSTRLRHYSGLRKTAVRLRRLLAEFRFGSIAESLAPTAALSS